MSHERRPRSARIGRGGRATCARKPPRTATLCFSKTHTHTQRNRDARRREHEREPESAGDGRQPRMGSPAGSPAAPPPPPVQHVGGGDTRARRPQLAAVCHPPASAAAAAAAAARAHEQLDLQVPLLALEDHSVPPKVPGALSLTSGSTRAPGPLDIHIIAGPGFFSSPLPLCVRHMATQSPFSDLHRCLIRGGL